MLAYLIMNTLGIAFGIVIVAAMDVRYTGGVNLLNYALAVPLCFAISLGLAKWYDYYINKEVRNAEEAEKEG